MFNMSKEQRKNAGLIISVVNTIVGVVTACTTLITVGSTVRKQQAETDAINNKYNKPKTENIDTNVNIDTK